MNTSVYYTPDDIMSVVAPQVDDTEFKVVPKGVYLSIIQRAFEELAMDTFFDERRVDVEIPNNLIVPLPENCFNVKNLYIFSGENCNISNSSKVWWKRNYYTKGGDGFIANDKGNVNSNEPFYTTHDNLNGYGNRDLIRQSDVADLNNVFYYNIQGGNIMLSSSCRGSGRKLHIHYNGTGCSVGEAPIIPAFLRSAIEDYLAESILRIRMAKDPRTYTGLWQIYDRRLRDPMNGSWEKAEYRIKTLNSSQREELKEYLSRGGWGSGL